LTEQNKQIEAIKSLLNNTNHEKPEPRIITTILEKQDQHQPENESKSFPIEKKK
jgi:hypothetical protein